MRIGDNEYIKKKNIWSNNSGLLMTHFIVATVK